jgi:thiamine pyrophosphokinase
LLVLSLERFNDEFLGQLLEWSPTVIVPADTAEKLSTAGIKIDVVLSLSASTDDIQSDIKYIHAGADNYLNTALTYLIANNYPAVNVVTDSFLLDDYVAFAYKINLVVYCGEQKIYSIISGFGKWKPAGEPIYLMGPVDNLQTKGLEKVTNNQYHTTSDGFIELQFTQPFIFIAEDIG